MKQALIMPDGTWYPLTDDIDLVEITDASFRLQFMQDGSNVACATSDISNELEDSDLITNVKLVDALKK